MNSWKSHERLKINEKEFFKQLNTHKIAYYMGCPIIDKNLILSKAIIYSM